MNRCKRLLCFVPLFLMVVNRAMGQPVVQTVVGTFADGGTVTVGGVAFGTKATPGPVLWDTFENGTLGNTIDDRVAVIGDWDHDPLPWNPVYSNAVVHSGTKSSYHRFKNGQYNVSLAKDMPFTRLYMDFWVYVDYVDQKSRNWKVWRFYGDDDGNELTWVYLCNAQFVATVDLDCTPSLNQNYWNGTHYSDRQWLHVQLEYKESGVNLSNGSVHSFVNSALAGVNSNTVKTRTCAHSLSAIRIGHYWADDPVAPCTANSGADIYIDNVYIDTSWARVEIGDQPTYAASSHREVQIPTAWSANSIAITANRGSFAPGQTVYVYVVDAAGSVNANGFPIVISGTAGIAPPSNLRVK
jgi:hypothetical protein